MQESADIKSNKEIMNSKIYELSVAGVLGDMKLNESSKEDSCELLIDTAYIFLTHTSRTGTKKMGLERILSFHLQKINLAFRIRVMYLRAMMISILIYVE